MLSPEEGCRASGGGWRWWDLMAGRLSSCSARGSPELRPAAVLRLLGPLLPEELVQVQIQAVAVRSTDPPHGHRGSSLRPASISGPEARSDVLCVWPGVSLLCLSFSRLAGARHHRSKTPHPSPDPSMPCQDGQRSTPSSVAPRAPPLGPQPALPRRTPAPAAAPRGLQADARPATGEGLAPRSRELANPSVRSWAAPSIVAVVWGGRGAGRRGVRRAARGRRGRRDEGGDGIEEAGSCGALVFLFFSLACTGSGLTGLRVEYRKTWGLFLQNV